MGDTEDDIRRTQNRCRTSTVLSSTSRATATGSAPSVPRRRATNSESNGLGLSLWELPPGEAAYPYHYHLAEEELVFVLDRAAEPAHARRLA